MVRLALRNPYLVIVGILAVFLVGITVFFRILADLLPIFKSPVVQVLTLYPGMPTTTMERDITNRIERWTSQSNGAALQESRSLLGVSVVRDFFRPDINPNAALAQVASLASSDPYYLPPRTIPPMVMPYDPTAFIPLALLTVSSKVFYDIAYFNVRNLLSGINGVIAPAVYGGRIRRIYVYVNPDKLAERGLSPLDVVNGLGQWNRLIPTGDAKMGSMDYFVVTNRMVPNVREINNFPLKVVDGAPVFVKAIGHAADTYEIQTNVVHVNGRREVYIPIYRQPGATPLRWCTASSRLSRESSPGFPPASTCG